MILRIRPLRCRSARYSSCRLALTLASFAALALTSARAANVTHVLSGTSSNISTATFTPTLASGGVAGDLIQYNTATTAYILTLDVNTTIGGVKVTNTGPLTITGGILTLDGTGISATVATGNIFGDAGVAFLGSATTAGVLTVNSAISMSTDLDIGSTVASGNVIIGGAITNGSGSAKNLNFRANNSGTITDTAAIGASGSGIAISNLGTSSGTTTLSGNLGASVTSVTENAAASGLVLSGANASFTGPVTLTTGTLTAQNSTTANTLTALGTGTLNLNGGTLSLKATPTANSMNVVTGDGTTGNNVVVGGNTTISFDRTGSTTGQNYVFNNLTIGAFTLTTTGNGTSTGQFLGTTTLTGNAIFNTGAGAASGALTLSGAIGDGGNGYGITKAINGTNTLTLTAANTYTGATVLGTAGLTTNAGTLTVSGANGSINASTSATISGVGSQLNLDYATQTAGSVDRFGNSSTITLNLGGEFRMSGSTTAATNTSETVGTLTLGTGYGIVSVNAPSTGATTLTASGISRGSNFATGLIRGTNIGTGSSNTSSCIVNASASTLKSPMIFGHSVSFAVTSQRISREILPCSKHLTKYY